jgi:ubiquinone/menaquinone biosynthesis C-methylase UbiE
LTALGQTGSVSEWWLDELAYAGAEHLDEDYVAGYARKAGFDPAGDLEVLARLGLGPHATMIDAGAGVGTFALAVAPLCREVIAFDVSPAMTAALGQRVVEAGLDNVSVVQAGFLSYEHHGPPVDFVYSRNALHQLPDFWKGIALHRLAATLRPGGILRLRDLVFDFDPSDAGERIEAWLAGGTSDPAVGWTPAELAEHVRVEFSTYRWLLEALLERTGFEILDAAFQRAAYGAYTCRRVR